MSNDTAAHEKLLEELAALYGILPEYWDIECKQHITSSSTRARLLAAMGVACADAEEAQRSLLEALHERWQNIIEPVVLGEEGEHLNLRLRLGADNRRARCYWRIELENRAGYSEGSFDLSHLPCRESIRLDTGYFELVEAWLPVSLPYGYHRLALSLVYPASSPGGAKRSVLSLESLLIVSPACCYVPQCLEQGRKLWGISAQLYSLRSARNWGIGDFADLKKLIQWAKSAGADFVGLNPLHAVSPRGDAGISPYSPVSRLVVNSLYLCLEDVLSLLKLPALNERIAGSGFQAKLAALRDKELVPYAEVAALKFELLEEIYAEFSRQHLQADSPQAGAFHSYLAECGEQLRNFGLFCALQEHFLAADKSLGHWSSWPAEYQDHTSQAAAAFLSEHENRVRFYQFVSWLAHLQLKTVKEFCAEHGLKVGLYLDVALGAAGGGAEAWVNKQLYAFQASMGAPPDKLAPQGQDWGLPPYNPQRLRQARYQPFIEMLRSSMQYAGALRIDHVMSLMRLYWVPGRGEAKNGAYVLYHLQELAAIVAIESRRQQCLVIGEDLGTVPDEVRQVMQRRRIFSYKVLYFMKDYGRGVFLRPYQYPPVALVVTSTHDLPTFKGYWEGVDLVMRKKLKLHEPEILEALRLEREGDRKALLDVLVEEGLLSADERLSPPWKKKQLPRKLTEYVHRFLARTSCMLQVLQLEDIMGQKDQMNLPGTTDEHVNWQRKLPLSLEKLEKAADAAEFLSLVDKERKNTSR